MAACGGRTGGGGNTFMICRGYGRAVLCCRSGCTGTGIIILIIIIIIVIAVIVVAICVCSVVIIINAVNSISGILDILQVLRKGCAVIQIADAVESGN